MAEPRLIDLKFTRDADGKKVEAAYATKRKRWRVWWPEEGRPNGRSKSFHRKDEAEAFLKRIRRTVDGNLKVDLEPKTMPFDRLARAWMTTLTSRNPSARRPHTERGYSVKMEKHLIGFFKGTPQNIIDREMVLDLITKMETPSAKMPKGYNPKMIRDVLSILSLVMKHAISKGMRTDNPALGHPVTVPVQPKRKQSDKAMVSLDDAGEIVEHIRAPYPALWWALVYTGIRPAEVCGFLIENFDNDPERGYGILWVGETNNYVHSYADQPAGVHRGPPKTHSGYREAFIPQFVADLIATILDERARAKGRPLQPQEPLFESIKGGKPLIPADLRRWIVRPALEAAGYDPAIRTYDLRHSAGTFWMDKGLSSAKVDRLMGHLPGSGVAERTYYHPGDAALREGMELMEAERQKTAATDPNVINLAARRKASER